jgi:uncharacterized protein (TIGR00290 family)
MKRRLKSVFNWSGGKDSALALHRVLEEGEYEVIALLSTIQEETGTSPLHDLPLELLHQQADSIGIPLYPVSMPKDSSVYDTQMQATVECFKQQEVSHFIFGDIHLCDIKAYRESRLQPLGVEVVEPLWGKSSEEVIDLFLQSGIKAKIIVVQADKLDKHYIGQDLDATTIQSFPKEIDICGEGGEYHSFCYAGGPFKRAIPCMIEEVMYKTFSLQLADGSQSHQAYWQARLKQALNSWA